MADTKQQHSGMQVLSLGMSRTGTASMKEALHILGHQRVHHAYELYTHPEQCVKWLAAWDAKAKCDKTALQRHTWDELLEGYTAVTDMPAVCFAQELIEAYPQAKVILVERDEQAWYQSFDTGVIQTYFDNAPVTGIISMLDHKLMRPIHELWTRLFAHSDGYFHSTTKSEMQKNALQVYRDHNALVRLVTPPERLLCFKLKDGWQPLCEFLQVDKPEVPFPSVNEGDAVKEVVAAFVNKSMKRAVLNLGIGVAVVAALLIPLLLSSSS
ncbi:hypothetical protein AMS68_006857 [Peltaster fructicola]|uniref:NAD dependent epimerase/dehydratase n=1 Tax=Peltaster fructicola TaxID=286661 RepID=A0A6H0Y3Z4_9PEZI|nr:hypothetical protein AMS68_006857 [Peltaster fructicola]